MKLVSESRFCLFFFALVAHVFKVRPIPKIFPFVNEEKIKAVLQFIRSEFMLNCIPTFKIATSISKLNCLATSYTHVCLHTYEAINTKKEGTWAREVERESQLPNISRKRMEEGEKKDPVVPDEQGKDDISGVWSSKGVTTKTFFSPKVTRVNSLTETPLSLRHGLASIQGIVVLWVGGHFFAEMHPQETGKHKKTHIEMCPNLRGQQKRKARKMPQSYHLHFLGFTMVMGVI